MVYKKLILLVVLPLMASCAGWSRCASSCKAESFGADWLIVQYRFDGTPLQCWRLVNKSVTNEDKSDGIYWKGSDGNLVHISGWYNRVQVSDGGWESAAHDLRVDLGDCDNKHAEPRAGGR